MKQFCLDPCKSVNPPAAITCCSNTNTWTCTDDEGSSTDVDFYPGASKDVDAFSTFSFYNESATHDTLCGMFGIKLGMKLHGNREARPLSSI